MPGRIGKPGTRGGWVERSRLEAYIQALYADTDGRDPADVPDGDPDPPG